MPGVSHSPIRRKELGAFYTPPEMAAKLVEWCIRSPADTILDPSFGGFVFLELARKRLLEVGADPRNLGSQVCGIDLDEEALRLARAHELADCRLIQADFFRVAPSDDLRFTANIGNPPYVRYQAWNGSAARAHLVSEAMGVKLTRLASTWAPFILHGCRFLEEGGRMGQVLPAELLHSQYARPVVDYLTASFRKVTVAVFEKKVFPGALEEVLLLFAEDYGRGAAPGIGVVSCRTLDDLDLDAIDGRGRGHLDPDMALLRLMPRATQTIYKRLADHAAVTTLGHLASVDIGAVTGANEFFMRRRAEIAERGFDPALFQTAVSKATDVSGARLSAQDVVSLDTRGKPTTMFTAKGATGEALETVSALIREGERAKLDRRYKCRIRTPWYAVPLPKHGAPDAFLTYMSNAFPRLVRNEVGALSTNTIHNVTLLNGESPAALCAAFYNSLTLLSAELVGRSYGGGILKLEPTEAERLLFPRFDPRLAETLPVVDALLRRGRISAALDLVDPVVLSPLGVTSAEIAGLRRARENLFARRRARSGRFIGKAKTNSPTANRRKTASR